MRQELKQYTFSSGISVQYRRVSQFSIREAVRAWIKLPGPGNAEPQPPKNQTDIGLIDNPADPDYQERKKEWQIRVSEIASEAYLKRGIVAEVDLEEVQLVRDDFKRMNPPIELDPDDQYVYITHIAILSEQDLTDIVNLIRGVSQATEESVQEAVATFPSEVESGGHIQNPGPSIQGVL